MVSSSYNSPVYGSSKKLINEKRKTNPLSYYDRGKLNSETYIKKIAKNYYKTLDRSSALSYIASRFVIQTWSKPYGYDDTLDRISKSEAQQLQAQRRRTSGGY